jgi:hypothetical protein
MSLIVNTINRPAVEVRDVLQSYSIVGNHSLFKILDYLSLSFFLDVLYALP